MSYPRYFEYTSAAVPIISKLYPEALSPMDKHFITTPNLQAGYMTIKKGEKLLDNFIDASSHVFYVLKGKGKTNIGTVRNTKKSPGKVILWNQGDVFTIPYYEGESNHVAFEDTILFTSDDSPLLNFLNCSPTSSRFNPTLYKNEEMMDIIQQFNSEKGSEKRNRNGILLSNEQMVGEKLNTITHTMWSLMNSIAPNTVQNPHKHNSIAIDLCVYADLSSEGKVYTLMGKELDQNGKIKDPVKMIWKKGHTFTTPPGWWHSHHNESNEEAWVFPVQDAGLHTFMRTLDIKFAEDSNHIKIKPGDNIKKELKQLESMMEKIKDKLYA